MEKQKIYILLAHSDKDSFNGALADVYEEKMKAAGHEIRRQNLGEMHFDPILHKGYHEIQPLEPDLLKAQEYISWCNKWVIFYPVWWGSVSALFKGFLDRTLLPGFAFKYHEKDPMWDKLLKGRSAHIITTSDGPSWWLFLVYRNSDLNTIKRAVLHFCGISPVRVTRIGNMRHLTKAQLEARFDAFGRKMQQMSA